MTVNRIRENRAEYRAALNTAMPNVGWNDPAAIPPHGLFNQRHAGVPVTPKTALQVDTVFTALRVLANGFVNLGDPQSFTYGFDDDNRRYKIWDKPQPPVLTNTFGNMYQFDGMTRTIISLGLFGEAWWCKLLYDDMGYCTTVEVLNPAFIEVKPDKKDASKVTYWYGSGVGKVQIPNASMIHIPFMAMPGANRGLSSIEYAGIAMALALAAMEFGSQWFAQGASPSFILSTEQKLGDEEILRIAQKFQVEHSGLKQAHLPLIADSGLRIEKSSSTPDEAQFIGTLDYTRMVLASYFGLPSHLVGSTADKGNVWGKTVQEQGYQMEDFTYSGYTKRIEEVYSFGSVFTPAGHKVIYNYNNLRRGDSAGIAAEIQQERTAGVKTQNDIRVERWEQKPLPGGDNLNQPINTVISPPPPGPDDAAGPGPIPPAGPNKPPVPPTK
jgi:HK97 family phage portal protein